MHKWVHKTIVECVHQNDCKSPSDMVQGCSTRRGNIYISFSVAEKSENCFATHCLVVSERTH